VGTWAAEAGAHDKDHKVFGPCTARNKQTTGYSTRYSIRCLTQRIADICCNQEPSSARLTMSATLPCTWNEPILILHVTGYLKFSVTFLGKGSDYWCNKTTAKTTAIGKMSAGHQWPEDSNLYITATDYDRTCRGAHTPALYSHQIACVTAIWALPPLPSPPPRSAPVASFAMLRVLRRLHSPRICCSCYSVVRFCNNLEACDLVTNT
jgi:hypothetical protein